MSVGVGVMEALRRGILKYNFFKDHHVVSNGIISGIGTFATDASGSRPGFEGFSEEDEKRGQAAMSLI